jgi:hypothetical protein
MTVAYDALLDSTGDLPIRPVINGGIEVLRQRLELRLSLALGNWFLDGSKGLPFSTWFETKPVPLDSIQTLSRAEIEDTPGVLSVPSWVAVWTESTRTVTITGQIVTEEGTVGATFRADLAARGTADWRYALIFSGPAGIVR